MVRGILTSCLPSGASVQQLQRRIQTPEQSRYVDPCLRRPKQMKRWAFSKNLEILSSCCIATEPEHPLQSRFLLLRLFSSRLVAVAKGDGSSCCSWCGKKEGCASAHSRRKQGTLPVRPQKALKSMAEPTRRSGCCGNPNLRPSSIIKG